MHGTPEMQWLKFGSSAEKESRRQEIPWLKQAIAILARVCAEQASANRSRRQGKKNSSFAVYTMSSLFICTMTPWPDGTTHNRIFYVSAEMLRWTDFCRLIKGKQVHKTGLVNILSTMWRIWNDGSGEVNYPFPPRTVSYTHLTLPTKA